ncbi:cellulase family glycosylhydrolase [Spirosoma taeanense]|uniref:Cellulase family glycosylhydrolase n=1 Tax=Spirosoma taeanense TaxID=2735870 RepID=A0A6M5YAH4_9BACT|nr:cellulase family glycosylhydrolase [Spirosoma taeanense]QJW90989.1 cellulase family glycosylhydrolase [Spirosoma taeanense]
MRFFLFFFALAFSALVSFGQTVAQKRATRLGLGMNLSYLEGYWNGTQSRHFRDFVKLNEVPIRKQRLADIAQAGFKTVRIPVSFGAWASIDAPYRWETPEFLAAPDSLVQWALANNLNVIIDLHHIEFDGSVKGADAPERLAWLWQQIAERYRGTDPERVILELRNEPHDMTAAAWRAQATQLIQTVRSIAPQHTLLVGFHDWNGLDALIRSEPFADPNLIYTFHFYDPFVFTHQGASWAGSGLPDLKGIVFPATATTKINVPASAKGTWVESAINNYASEATYENMYRRLELAKNWSVAKSVPIFLGEFGSYNLNADADSRCRHAEAIYVALGKLQIPSAWWEWDGGFAMFEKGTTQLMPCMKAALNTYQTGQPTVLHVEPDQENVIQLYPNPARDAVRIVSTRPIPTSVRIADLSGKVLMSTSVTGPDIAIVSLPAGQYVLTLYDKTSRVLGTARLVKQ